MKNPKVVAVLNFFTLGLGTLLLGKRPLYAVLVLIAGSLLRYEELRIAPLQTGVLTIHWVFAVTGLTLWGIAAAIDGYKEAQT